MANRAFGAVQVWWWLRSVLGDGVRTPAGSQAVCVARSGFRQNGVLSPRTSTGVVTNPAHAAQYLVGAYPLQGATQTQTVRLKELEES
jgi:hypothetical protein